MLSFLRRQWYRWYTQQQLNEALLSVTNVAVAQDLLALGADLNACDDAGNTPLILAATEGYIEVAQLFLQLGCEVDAENNTNKTALFYSCKYGELEMVRFLLQNGANVNTIDEKGRTPLMVAARNGHINVVELLLGFQAEPDCLSHRDETALMFAVSRNHLEVVRLLLKKNANIELADIDGRTTLIYAAQYADAEMVRAFFIHNPGLNVNAVNIYGHTALTWAATKGNKDAVEELCLCGADYNVFDNEGMTAILSAAEHEQVEVVTYLLNLKDIIVNNPNEMGVTALQFFECDTRAKFEKEYDKLQTLLREKGGLEYNKELNVINNSQSVHDERTKVSVAETIKKLSADKNENNIRQAYQAFVQYLESDLFEQDIANIAKNPFGEDDVQSVVKDMSIQERVDFLRYELKGAYEHLGYIQHMNNPQNSSVLQEQFKKVAGLVWLAITETEHLLAIQALRKNGVTPTETQVIEVLTDVRHTLCKGILSICCQFFQAGQPPAEQEEYAACPEGAIHYHLAILNQIHDQVRVTNQPLEYVAPTDRSLTIKESLLIKGFEGLEKVLKTAFMGRISVLQFIIEGLAVEKCSEDTFRSFLENTNQFPRTPGLQKTLEFFLGNIKKHFEPKTTEGYRALEMALIEMPYSEVAAILNNMLPEPLFVIVEPKLILTVQEQVIALLHAYIDHELKLLEDNLSRVSRDELSPIGERMVQLQFKKRRLPLAKDKAPAGDIVKQLETVFLAPENRALNEAPLFTSFREEAALSRCFATAIKRTYAEGPAIPTMVSFSAQPLASAADDRRQLCLEAAQRRKLTAGMN